MYECIKSGLIVLSNIIGKKSLLNFLVLLLSIRYEILTPNAIPRTFMDGKQASELMVSANVNAFSEDLLNAINVSAVLGVIFFCFVFLG